MTWEKVPLGELIELKYGKALKAGDREQGEFPVVGSGGVVGSHNVALTRGPTIVVGRKGSIGSLTFTEQGCWPIDTAYFVSPRREVNLRWLFRTMDLLRLDTMNKSAAVPGLNREDAYRALIPLPPLPEQRRIAAILDEADALRAQAHRASELRSSLVTEEFILRFASRDLIPVRVEDLAAAAPGAIRTGPFGSDLLHSEFVEQGIPVLGIDNVVGNTFTWAKPRHITNSKYETLRRYTVRPGDVLISIMGTVGRCAVAPDDIGLAINTKHLCCISLDRAKCEPEFLQSYFLHHPVAREYLRRTSKGAIMDGLNMGVIKALPVALPPIEEQCDYVEWSARARALHLKSRAARLDALFASLQHRAFRGEL